MSALCPKGGSAGRFDPNRSRAPTAIASLHLFAARRRTRSAPKKGASCRTTRTRSRRGRPSEYAVNLGGHDEVVLMQSLDLLGLQRDRRIAPTEADIRMMAFGFREFTNLLNKGKRLAEIAKPEAPLDAVSFLGQLPVRGLCVKELSVLAREWISKDASCRAANPANSAPAATASCSAIGTNRKRPPTFLIPTAGFTPAISVSSIRRAIATSSAASRTW